MSTVTHAHVRAPPRSSRDLRQFGYGLDRKFFVVMACALTVLGAALIWYATYLDAKVRESARQRVPSVTQEALEEEGDSFLVPLPEVTVCLALAPENVLLEFPSPTANRVGLFPNGITTTVTEDLENDTSDTLAASGGLFIRGPESSKAGQDYFGSWTGRLEAGSAGRDGEDGGYLRMSRNGLIRVRLFVSSDVTATPRQSLNLPPATAFVYLTQTGQVRPRWMEEAMRTARNDKCLDTSLANVTAVAPEGSYLLRYRQVKRFRDDGDHSDPEDLVETFYSIRGVSKLAPSRVKETKEIQNDPNWEKFVRERLEDPERVQYIRDFILGPQRCGAEDPVGCVSILDFYLQYDGEMAVDLVSRQSSYDTSAAFSDLVAAASFGFQALVTAGTVAFGILATRARKREEDQAAGASRRAGRVGETEQGPAVP